MAVSQERMEAGRKVFQQMVSYLRNEMNLNFEEYEREDRFGIEFNMSGDDLPMKFFIDIRPGNAVVKIRSSLPVKFDGDKLELGCQAVTVINYRLSVGRFYIDPRDGEVIYDLVSYYSGSRVNNKLFEALIGISVNIVDEFNDKLLLLAKDMYTLDALKESLNY